MNKPPSQTMANDTVIEQATAITTEDGCTLHGMWFQPVQANTFSRSRVVIISSGMAIPNEFYSKFARALCSMGYHVFTQDFRGVGKSFNQPIAGKKILMSDWGRRDITAVMAFAQQHIGNAQYVFFGHSSGGHTLGLSPKLNELSGLILVASQSGYWGHWRYLNSRKETFKMWATWKLIRLFSYFPMHRVPFHWFRFSDVKVAMGISAEQSRWGLRKAYLFDKRFGLPVEAYAQFDKPILAVSFEPDPFAPKSAVDAYMAQYKNAPMQRHHIEDKAIGHFTAFKTQQAYDRLLPMIDAFFDGLPDAAQKDDAA